MEKEESEEEVKELQEKVSSMKRQMPDPSQAQTLNQVQETPPQHCWAAAGSNKMLLLFRKSSSTALIYRRPRWNWTSRGRRSTGR